jgi:hypothetical protein
VALPQGLPLLMASPLLVASPQLKIGQARLSQPSHQLISTVFSLLLKSQVFSMLKRLREKVTDGKNTNHKKNDCLECAERVFSRLY